MDEKKAKRTRTKLKKETIKKMQALGVYREEFITFIERYCEMRTLYSELMEEWRENGCKITESYTNKAGATNERKTVLYLSIEALRKELADMESTLGLTPKGLKAIKAKGLDVKKKSVLGEALAKLE